MGIEPQRLILFASMSRKDTNEPAVIGQTSYLRDLFTEVNREVCTTVVGVSCTLPPEQANLIHERLVEFKDFFTPTPGCTGRVGH